MAQKRKLVSDAPAKHEYLGQTLDGRYELVSFLGKGGMGSVFFARHVLIGKPVAVKVLERQRVSEPKLVTRLFREAQVAASIRHPNIIDVIDVGVAPKGDPYLVMEYLEGEDLASLLGRVGPISVAAACAILEPVLLALQAAHKRGVVHRDLKPGNVFLARQENAPPVVKLIDFGVAKYLGPVDARITVTGTLLGTACYMPPEQAMGNEDVDARADLYAIGVTLYEMITGRVPFKGSNYNDTIIKIVKDEPPPPESPKERLDDATVTLVLRALSKSPGARFQSAEEFLESLKGLNSFQHRTEAFAELAKSIQIKALGGGEPASATHAVPRSPVNLRYERPSSEEQDTVLDKKPAGPSWLRATALPAVGMVLLLGLLVVLLDARRGPAPVTQSASSPKALRPSTRVHIRVEGAPDGAKLFYNDTYVATNPFSVKSSNKPAKLRVELAGYNPFLSELTPNQDRTVRVRLHKLVDVAEPERDEARDAREPSRERPSPRTLKQPKAPPARPSAELGRSGRDTFYSEKFE